MLNGDREPGEVGSAGELGFRDVELFGEYVSILQFFRHQPEGYGFSRGEAARVAAAFWLAHSASPVSVALIVVDVCRLVKGICQRMSTIGERIAKVRKASGLSQEAFGKIGGVSRQTQINYEKGDRLPDADYFAGVSAAGFDVLYMISGEAEKRVLSVNERRPSSYSPAEVLAIEIAEMRLSADDASILRALAKRLAHSTNDD